MLKEQHMWYKKKMRVCKHTEICQSLTCSFNLKKKKINRIEKMWMRDGAGYFFGPIFIHPEETEHEPTKMFYKREVFLSNLEETCPMTCILGTITRHL